MRSCIVPRQTAYGDGLEGHDTSSVEPEERDCVKNHEGTSQLGAVCGSITRRAMDGKL
jgi:hypothetical protein